MAKKNRQNKQNKPNENLTAKENDKLQVQAVQISENSNSKENDTLLEQAEKINENINKNREKEAKQAERNAKKLINSLTPQPKTKTNFDDVDESDIDEDKLTERVTQLEKLTKSLNPTQKQQFWEKYFETNHGLSKDQFKNIQKSYQDEQARNLHPDFKFQPSQFFENLGWYLVEQELVRIKNEYEFADLIPIEVVEKGAKMMFYKDFTNADELPAYTMPKDKDGKSTYVETFYESETTLKTKEVWSVYKDVHKGIRIPLAILNDFTSFEAIFAGLAGEYAFHIAHPINKEFFKLRLKMIQNPRDVISDNLDWKDIPSDYVIKADTKDEALSKFKTLCDELSVSSRNIMPKDWIPQGFTNPLEIKLNMSGYRWILPPFFKNDIDVLVKAGTFNEKYLNVMPAIQAFPYSRFIEYGTAKTVSTDYTSLKTFLHPVGDHKIIQMYKGVRSQPLLNFFDVTHAYSRYGHLFKKDSPTLVIEFQIGQTAPAK